MSMHRFAFHPFALALVLCAGSAGAATFNVSRADDPAPNGCLEGDCSLREALEASAATPESDTILLVAGQYQVTLDELAINSTIAIRGAGSTATRVTSAGAFNLFTVLAFGDLTIESAEIGSATDSTMEIDGGGKATLRDVNIPASAGPIATLNGSGASSMLVEDSTIATPLACYSQGGTCRILDSRVYDLVIGDSIFEMRRSELDGENTDHYGVSIASMQPVTIADSTIRRTGTPLRLLGSGDLAPAVHIARTRFLDNTGPVFGNRSSYVYMDDVEFRHHVVSDDFDTAPAVLLAGPGPSWAISRALVAENRGGSGDGAAVRVTSGGRVIFDNSTFYDNTFRSGLGGYGDTIGVYNSNASTTIAWLIHVTLRQALALDEAAVGSLLTSRGTGSDVRVFNSAFRGTCALSSGGFIATALGNLESSGDTCTFDPATNQVDIPTANLFLTDLDDHGGFTDTLYPNNHSPLRDNADPDVCAALGSLDQRGYVRPADGVDCDVGAVESLAVADAIFADAFDGE